MSFDDTRCVCGGTKRPATLVGPECHNVLQGSRDWIAYHDQTYSMSFRRSAAIRLLAAARRRKRGAK